MRERLVLLVIVVGLSSWRAGVAAIGDPLGTIPTPAGNPFGITWDGANLWVSTQSGAPNTIWQINPVTGVPITSFNAAGNSSQGLAWDGGQLFSSDAVLGISRITPAGAILETQFFADLYTGLTWNGSRLIAINASDITIDTINPATWTVESTIPGLGGLTGLTWDGSSLWVVQNATSTVFELNPGTGAVISSFVAAGGLSLHDITIDGSGNIRIPDSGGVDTIRTYVGPGSSATPLSLGGVVGSGLMVALSVGMWMVGRRGSHPSGNKGEDEGGRDS